jgi:hypothetical protein
MLIGKNVNKFGASKLNYFAFGVLGTGYNISANLYYEIELLQELKSLAHT